VRKDAAKIIIFLLSACQDSTQMKVLFNHLYPTDIFLSVEDANGLVKLIADVAKEVREDREVRLEQFKTAKKKMDEEDIEYFEEDVRKVDKIENRK